MKLYITLPKFIQLTNVFVDTTLFVLLEIAAIRAVGCLPLLCYFHLMQAIDRQFNQKRHNVREIRGSILDGVRALKHAATEAEFRLKLDTFETTLGGHSTSALSYFKETYICATPAKHKMPLESQYCIPTVRCLCLARRWANFGNRSDIPNRGCDETTNLAEAHFRKLKYTFLATRIHRRLSDLVMIILEELIPFYVREQLMKRSLRYTDDADERHSARQSAVDLLCKDGSITWIDVAVGTADVTNANRVNYHVCLADMTCTCPYATQSRTAVVCKHMEACHIARSQVSYKIAHTVDRVS
jgi:hypothetical protein